MILSVFYEYDFKMNEKVYQVFIKAFDYNCEFVLNKNWIFWMGLNIKIIYHVLHPVYRGYTLRPKCILYLEFDI
jgi:hypothetical protein